MNGPDAAYHRALESRDRRFDGVFYVGVTSTGVYCRPVCTAKPTRPDRRRFFSSAPEAERGGFRPCLLCRPELAPGLAPIDSAGRIARLASGRIESGALDRGERLEGLAGELGLSSRQLRRVFERELGVSPVAFAQTHRLLLAKRLIVDTDLSMTAIAHASGFGSTRRFNALFRARYRLTPGELRRRPQAATAGSVSLELSYRSPFAWDELIAFFARRAIPGIEAVTERRYARTVVIGREVGWIRAEPCLGKEALRLEISLNLLGVLPTVLFLARRAFDLDARPDVIADHLGDDEILGESVRRTPGLRAPGAFDGFELAVRTVLGQRISVAAARTLAIRFFTSFGPPLETSIAGLTHAPPTPDQIAGVKPAEIAALGIAPARAELIQTVAREMAKGDLRLDPAADPDETLSAIRRLKGFGEWSAQYLAMRAIHRPDAFPHADLGLLRGAGIDSPRRLLERSQAWKPWRAYAAIHLWNLAGNRPVNLKEKR